MKEDESTTQTRLVTKEVDLAQEERGVPPPATSARILIYRETDAAHTAT